MSEKIKLVDGKAKFICPVCFKAKSLDMSEHKDTATPVKVNCKCTCGHAFTVLLDKRQYKRTKVTLPGVYIRYIEDKEVNRKTMTVVDLSPFGLKFMLHEKHNIQPSDRLEVIFNLNDPQETQITRKMVVKYVKNLDVGAEFFSKDQHDEICLYLGSLDARKEV